MKRRLLATLVTACLVLGLLPGSAWAETDIEPSNVQLYAAQNRKWYTIAGGELYFDLDSGTVLKFGYYNAACIDIPSQIDGVNVTAIGEEAFYCCNRLTHITIPSGVTSIGKNAFSYCYALASITLPDGVTSIGDRAFVDCSNLTSISIPSGVKSIGEYTFWNCSSLASITIPSGVTSIGDYAFIDCSSLASINIPDSVTSIGDFAFEACTSLTNITVPSGVTSIGDSAFSHCRGLTSITIPSSVTSIGDSAFFDCAGLTSITIPSSVTSIGDYAFGSCTGLTSAGPIGGGYNYEFGWADHIPSCAFSGCTGLVSINIPSSVIDIGYGAFSGCEGLTDVYYPGTEEQWETISVANYNDSLINATIHYNSTGPDDVGTQSIDGILRSGDGWKIRWKCSYKEDADGNPSKGSVEITVNDTNTTEELYLYDDSGKAGFPWEREPYNIPKSAIETLAVRGRPTKKLRLATNSFKGYSGLKNIVFDFVSGVDSYAFEGCSALEQVGFLNEGSGFTTIDDDAFRNCTNLTKMDFPGSLTSIGAAAFKNTGLGTITLGSNITEIGADAFVGCKNLMIWCYENSVAHQYAQANSLPFKLITIAPGKPGVPVTFYMNSGGAYDTRLNWEFDLLQKDSSKYDTILSETGLILSAAAERQETATKSLLKQLGFNTHYDSMNYFEDEGRIFYPGVSFAHQENVTDGQTQHYFAIVVRGTTITADLFTDVAALVDGFSTAGMNVLTQFKSFVEDTCNLNLAELAGNSRFFITGHSLGGATANVLAKELSDIYGESNVYGYTFAAPGTSMVPSIGRYTNIHNIINKEDGWPKTPLVHRFRYGREDRFHRDDYGDYGFYDNYRKLTGTSFEGADAHAVETYMSYVLIRDRKCVSQFGGVCWACPVNVEVYDPEEQLVGAINNNEVTNILPEKLCIFVEDDAKYIYFLEDGEYTFKVTSTGEGTMVYSTLTLDVAESTLSEGRVFSNIHLAKDKQFSSTVKVTNNTVIGGEGNLEEVKIFVLDSSGNPEKEVLPDGNGTEVPITKPVDPSKPDEPTPATYTITFDPNSGSVTPTSAKTVADGKLTALPIPIRAGYSFQGWYTAISGGSVVTTDTVFAQNTTVYAHWNYNGSSGPNGGGSTGGDVTYPSDGNNSGGGASTPNYSITAPSAPGGTVTISPKSAAKGATVAIAVKPDDGYELLSLIVIDGSNKEIPLTDQGNGKYTFAMPGSKVTVNARFQTVQSTTVPTPETPWSNPFTDVSEESWYYDAVKFVGENGLMSGIGNDVFAPDASLSRAMLAQILYNKEGKPNAAGINVFTDVAPGEWYSNAITWTAANNIVGGYGNGLFGPNDNITREQLAVMLWRYAGEPVFTNKELHFSDAKEVSSYAIGAISWAVENGIVNGKGDNILDPKGFATRAQVAQMLKNFLEK